MPSAQERAKALAREMMNAIKEAKAAEARARQLGKEAMQVLAEAKMEAEATHTILEYPTGSYECKSCGHCVLSTEVTRELPVCDNCGNREYAGAAPKVRKTKAPPPKKYPSGMYECGGCGERIVIAEGSDTRSPCDLCGADKLKAV
jgi:rubrerythrin